MGDISQQKQYLEELLQENAAQVHSGYPEGYKYHPMTGDDGQPVMAKIGNDYRAAWMERGESGEFDSVVFLSRKNLDQIYAARGDLGKTTNDVAQERFLRTTLDSATRRLDFVSSRDPRGEAGYEPSVTIENASDVDQIGFASIQNSRIVKDEPKANTSAPTTNIEAAPEPKAAPTDPSRFRTTAVVGDGDLKNAPQNTLNIFDNLLEKANNLPSRQDAGADVNDVTRAIDQVNRESYSMIKSLSRFVGTAEFADKAQGAELLIREKGWGQQADILRDFADDPAGNARSEAKQALDKIATDARSGIIAANNAALAADVAAGQGDDFEVSLKAMFDGDFDVDKMFAGNEQYQALSVADRTKAVKLATRVAEDYIGSNDYNELAAGRDADSVADVRYVFDALMQKGMEKTLGDDQTPGIMADSQGREQEIKNKAVEDLADKIGQMSEAQQDALCTAQSGNPVIQQACGLLKP